jgi:cytochrome P450
MALVKEVLAERTGLFLKDYMNPSLEVILGKGLILLDGDDWRRHRRVIHPVFNQGKLKVNIFSNSTSHRLTSMFCILKISPYL